MFHLQRKFLESVLKPIAHSVALVRYRQNMSAIDGSSVVTASLITSMGVMPMQPKTELCYCDRREAEKSYAGRYFGFLEKQAREQEQREREEWLRALTRGYRRPF